MPLLRWLLSWWLLSWWLLSWWLLSWWLLSWWLLSWWASDRLARAIDPTRPGDRTNALVISVV